VILGAPNVDSSLIQFETVTHGDPTYAGPLAGVQLGLKAYHVFEPELKSLIDPARYTKLIEILELGLESETIVRALQEVRGRAR
jgi:betaine reductase